MKWLRCGQCVAALSPLWVGKLRGKISLLLIVGYTAHCNSDSVLLPLATAHWLPSSLSK